MAQPSSGLIADSPNVDPDKAKLIELGFKESTGGLTDEQKMQLEYLKKRAARNAS